MDNRRWIPKHLPETHKQMHNMMQIVLDSEQIPHIQLEMHEPKIHRHENEVYKGKIDWTVNVVMNLRELIAYFSLKLPRKW